MLTRMKTIAIFAATLLGLVAFTAPAAADSYTNARYGYTIEYPPGVLAAQPEPDNGDGRHFTAPGADLAVWASYNALNQSAADIAREAAGDCLPRAQVYRLIKPTVVVVSCPTAKGILYRKTYLRGDILTSFEFTYATAGRARWNGVVARITLTPAK